MKLKALLIFSFMFLSCTEWDIPQTKIEFSYKYYERLDFGEYHIYDIPFHYSQTIDSNLCLITKEVEGREAVLYQLNLYVDHFKLNINSIKSDTIKLIPVKKKYL
ncbi:MAG: hypothetical protein ACPGSD_12370 [Flavobacteriales bacterium]